MRVSRPLTRMTRPWISTIANPVGAASNASWSRSTLPIVSATSLRRRSLVSQRTHNSSPRRELCRGCHCRRPPLGIARAALGPSPEAHRMKIRSVVALLAAIALVDTVATTAAADTQTTNNAPYSCTTSPNLGNQAATLSVTASDTVDPATPGDAETYRFVVPFSQAQPPVTAMYQGGTTSWRIPAAFSVTSVSMQ